MKLTLLAVVLNQHSNVKSNYICMYVNMLVRLPLSVLRTGQQSHIHITYVIHTYVRSRAQRRGRGLCPLFLSFWHLLVVAGSTIGGF